MSRKKINLVKYILADPRHDSAYSSCTFIDFIHKIPLSKLKRDFVLLHHDNTVYEFSTPPVEDFKMIKISDESF